MRQITGVWYIKMSTGLAFMQHLLLIRRSYFTCVPITQQWHVHTQFYGRQEYEIPRKTDCHCKNIGTLSFFKIWSVHTTKQLVKPSGPNQVTNTASVWPNCAIQHKTKPPCTKLSQPTQLMETTLTTRHFLHNLISYSPYNNYITSYLCDSEICAFWPKKRQF